MALGVLQHLLSFEGDLLEGQLLPPESPAEVQGGQEHKQEARRRNDPCVGLVRPLLQDPDHEDAVEGQGQIDVIELRNPERSAKVRLLALRVDDQVAIQQSGEQAVDHGQHGYHGRDATEENAKHDIDGKIYAPSTEAKTVLVLRLRQALCLLLSKQHPEEEELGQIHMSQHLLGMGRPLEDEVSHIEVRGVWDIRGHDRKD
mmetsp:Transcript_50721/g.94787  ORF Transcript_50721/g.94787 Transcript_50721/m.94787 type:complete len:202 (-) Transcript_50721:1666-2271(-)